MRTLLSQLNYGQMRTRLILIVIAVLAMSGCGQGGGRGQAGKNGAAADACVLRDDIDCSRGIYFWKSVFRLSDNEVMFLKSHEVKKLYVKMFDVAAEAETGTDNREVVPVATTRFVSTKPADISIIPTVYITLEALKLSAGKEPELAKNIVDRVLAMASFNDLGPIGTIQLDCDWTESTRSSYFTLCREVRKLISRKGILLSGTVRLHQVYDKGLPFDKCVLMIYNLGGIRRAATRNSILDYDTVKKYVDRQAALNNFDFAYPAFGWGVWFRGTEFMGLLHTTDFSDRESFEPCDGNSVRVLKAQDIENHKIKKGDTIRIETSEIGEILKVKKRIERFLGREARGDIIYHLDSLNLLKYAEYEIENIYR